MTVTYAEAVTMAIRVLGYRTVVEAKGTWPTNYIAKATELKTLDDISYGSYSDGAKRGNVAKLIWNTLRAPVWDVDSENESNGLNYKKTGETMIDKYFEDYTYSKVLFEDFTINDDAEVIITLDDSQREKGQPELEQKSKEYKYTANDFYTFVSGTEVEVLVNEKNETLLMIVPTGKDKLVEGTKLEIDDKYDALSGDAYDYVYAKIEKKDVSGDTRLHVASKYVYKLDASNKNYVKVNGVKENDEDYESRIILLDGERVTLRDIKLGDVISTVTVGEDTDAPVFYVISRNSQEGKLTEILVKDYDNSAAGSYVVATVDGKVYPVASGDATYLEDPESDDTPSLFDSTSWNTDMEKEIVTINLDFLGRIAFVGFDGDINGDASSEDYRIAFYATKGNVEKADSKTYILEVENEDGDDKFNVTKTFGASYYSDDKNADLEGSYIVATINDDDVVEEFTVIGRANGEDGYVAISGVQSYVYDKDNNNSYVAVPLTTVSYSKDDKKVTGNSGDEEWSIDVNKDVVVVILTHDDKGTERTSDDVYSAEFDEGLKKVEKMKNEKNAVVIYDNSSKFTTAKYIVLFDETSNREEDLIGMIDEDIANNEIGKATVVVTSFDKNGDKDDEEKLIVPSSMVEDVKKVALMLYSTKEDKDGNLELDAIKAALTFDELTLAKEAHGYIAKSTDKKDPNVDETGRKALVDVEGTSTIYDLDADANSDKYEDYRIAIVTVSEDSDNEGTYEIDNVKEVSYANLTLKELDRISINDPAEVFIVIRGMAERDA